MEENKNKFWKGFLIGAFCFFVIGALAVLGMTRFLENIADNNGKRSGTAEPSITGEQPTQAALPTSPSTAIAPVTLPSEGTEPVTQPSAETQNPSSAQPSQAEPRTIDRNEDVFLDELEEIEALFAENQVLPYDLNQMQQEALKSYVELAGGNWDEYQAASPSYGPEVTVIARQGSAFLNRMGEIRELVDERIHPDETAKKEIEVAVLKAFVAASGDAYSDYLTQEEWASTQESSEGVYCGIGVQIMQDPETMEATITNVFSNGPAKEAGMLVGDIFKKVDGMDVTQMPLDQMVTYVRGHEGEPVVITIYRPASGETLEIACIRRQVEVDTVSYEMLTDQVGYLQLMEFDNVTIRQVQGALETMQKQGMQKLILDLRGNPGGLLNSVLSIADFFTKRGDLLFRMDYVGGEVYTERSSANPIFQGKMVVLVDGGSASAAEVLTGILQDYKLASVMGKTTFGKGIVQSFFDMESGSVLKLTIAHYYSPLGRDFHGTGIAPDIEGEDNVLTEQDELVEQALKELE